MQKTLLLSLALSAFIYAAENAPTNPTPQEQTMTTVQPEVVTPKQIQPMVVQPVVVQPVVVTPPAPKKEEKAEEESAKMEKPKKQMPKKSAMKKTRINVVGQGVAPTMTTSPAQAYALAKRAAIADAYRLLAEKVKGVRIEGQDKIKNMMVQRSEVRTFVDAMIAEAQIIETVFKDGLCEVEMELVIDPEQWEEILASR